MQNKTTQHKRSTLYAIKKKAIRQLKTKEMIKDYMIIMIKKYRYVPSVPKYTTLCK